MRLYGETTGAMVERAFNRLAAGLLRECADLLSRQNANPFRVDAYRRAASTLDELDADALQILRLQGREGLEELPGIGAGLAGAIAEIARTGRLTKLERLRGESSPETLFQSVPGIGPELAARIHDTLHVDTLESLEIAAHDGSLARVEAIGERRAAAIRAGVADVLGRRPGRDAHDGARPSVATLLDVDREYRERAAAGDLPKIAPRRFNPENRAWLPILHSDRGDWHFSALYSNTARAHELGRTNDWVVIYFDDSAHREGQCTVVTEPHGPLGGKRVVRGREGECRRFYGA